MSPTSPAPGTPTAPRRGRVSAAVVALLALVVTGCSVAEDPRPGADRALDDQLASFPVGAAPDYQLGGAYDPPSGVGIVGRDRQAAAPDDAFSICYVNGFQTQPAELSSWPEELLLTRDSGPVFDPDWPDEALLDTSSADNRAMIVDVVGPWIEGCAEDGFDAVEFDNLDTFTRSGDALDVDDNLELARALVDVAHGAGLLAGQKNAAEFAPRLRSEAGFDFAVVEECAAFEECGSYTEVYGDAVVDIEYTDNVPRPFTEVCADPATPTSVVLRDRDLVLPDDPAYVFELCER